ncbi:hypothetical protein, conserved [Leishmania donovani]|uniref:Uncharacterized protein n=1 Tax=Leishmania donovani TaxID=5661 RepID=E9BLV6_LEIDO|nr:hypothetical protein, conserved [Leishmania donovani]CBZ36234.1 hypothetical protein, conserved [Leishmania donovani]
MWNGCSCACTYVQARLFMYAYQTAHKECAALPSPHPDCPLFSCFISSVCLLFVLQAPSLPDTRSPLYLPPPSPWHYESCAQARRMAVAVEVWFLR